MDEAERFLEVLKSGGLVIFPTETVLGLGCRLGSPEGIRRLYTIKRRALNKPTSIVVKDLHQAQEYAQFDQSSEALAKKFWPGPLTLVLRAKKNSTKPIQGLSQTVGLRVPSHGLLLNVLQRLNEPILAPSANLAGESAPVRVAQVDSKLVGMVDYVVNENAWGEKPSTVLDLSNPKPSLLRQGSISLDQINLVLKEKGLG
ncbi:MAG: L-threonylcarbamoyladenylate synthase [bacterium]|nr:L-threonylcarbamoyladenylate synthase [bacterium]